jgi:hypothetical protein
MLLWTETIGGVQRALFEHAGPGFFGAADRARLGGELASRLTYGKAADLARPGDQGRRGFHATRPP